ncbi:MAG: FeoB-associated Cys-rich membrane protein [Treponema sp.]|nr:FeoB-associated Cys-rich membrane protein [Treponema sp.]
MGTMLVGVVLAAVVAAICRKLVKDKKRGRSSCGGNCAHCAACRHE